MPRPDDNTIGAARTPLLQIANGQACAVKYDERSVPSARCGVIAPARRDIEIRRPKGRCESRQYEPFEIGSPTPMLTRRGSRKSLLYVDGNCGLSNDRAAASRGIRNGGGRRPVLAAL